ncbi:MAG TPA: S8 family serine peptidase, partial [Roseiflexaceae bacterium]|nr:S8 family serine peptidase [Roseiflexaceae bacterium]
MITLPFVRRTRTLGVLLFCLALIVPLSVWAGPAQVSQADVDPAVVQQVSSGQHTRFWVLLRNKANLSTAARAPGWAARGGLVVQDLQETAARTQAGVRALLDGRHVQYRPFWIVNAIEVTGDQALLTALESLPEVAAIVADQRVMLPKTSDQKRAPHLQALEWNIERVRAPEVWSTFDDRGEGIVVATIDSGVQFDHPALVNQYRGNAGGAFDHNYNWFDATLSCPTAEPCDTFGRGTHAMGTIVGGEGDNQIGVAPGAKWITANVCGLDGCTFDGLVAASQWILAPTDLA